MAEALLEYVLPVPPALLEGAEVDDVELLRSVLDVELLGDDWPYVDVLLGFVAALLVEALAPPEREPLLALEDGAAEAVLDCD